MTTTFLGVDSGYPAARVVILPAPYDATTTYMPGARFGPRAILQASQELELYDREFGCDVWESIGIHTAEDAAIWDSTEKMIAEVESRADQVLAAGKMPFMLGGDHSLTLGAVRATASRHPDLQVVQFDAHADLREEYRGNRFSHACVARRMQELIPVLQAGVRSLCQEEADFIRQSSRVVTGFREDLSHPGWWRDQVSALRGRPVYLTIDVDVLDPSVMPATGTPEPGGIDWMELVSLIRTLSLECRIVGADCMELSPLAGVHAPDFAAAKLVYKTIALACR